MQTGWQFLISLHSTCHFRTKEGNKTQRASNSELKRWMLNKAVVVNGEPLSPDEPMDFKLFSMVLFPNSKKITLL